MWLNDTRLSCMRSANKLKPQQMVCKWADHVANRNRVLWPENMPLNMAMELEWDLHFNRLSSITLMVEVSCTINRKKYGTKQGIIWVTDKNYIQNQSMRDNRQNTQPS